MSVTDEMLVSRIASGDREAFAQFYHRYAPRMLGLLTRRLRDRVDAEDALQDTFARVWVAAGEFDARRGMPIVWLTRIAISRGIDLVRRRPRTLPERGTHSASTDACTLRVDRADLMGRTERAMQQLTPIERELLRSAFFDGRTHEQLAQERGLPLGTVKTHIRRGMQRLRDKLAEVYQGEAV